MQSSGYIIWRHSHIGSVSTETDGRGVNHGRKEFPPKNATELASFTLRERAVFERFSQLAEREEYKSRVWLISSQERRGTPSNPSVCSGIRSFSQK